LIPARAHAATGVALALAACHTAVVPSLRPLPEITLATATPPPVAVDATTMAGKLLLGYQGWFACPEDGSRLAAWQHWFRRDQPPSAATVRVDMWPDVSELGLDERCRTPFTFPDGRPAEVYSAYNAKTVDRHFRWMEEHGLAGVFAQRFTVRLGDPRVLDFRNHVLRNVRAGAEAHGRVFAVMYDVSGDAREGLVEKLERDWAWLVDELRITESPRYLRHRGRPVLAVWGLGFHDRPATPEQAAEIVRFLRVQAGPRHRVTLVGGVPARWRTLRMDSHRDPSWADVYRSFDVISPWTVGRFRDDAGVDRFYRNEVGPDLRLTRRLGVDYMPVVFPGFSWHHLRGNAPLNQVPRRGGRFYWRQVQRALGAGATMMYGAMFDEVDEGTAMFKLAAGAAEAPRDAGFVTLDADGERLPRDWYLRLAGETQRALGCAGGATGVP
jgi:hypothetical protein